MGRVERKVHVKFGNNTIRSALHFDWCEAVVDIEFTGLMIFFYPFNAHSNHIVIVSSMPATSELVRSLIDCVMRIGSR